MRKIEINTLIVWVVAMNWYLGILNAQNRGNLNQALNERQQKIVAISVYTAKGDLSDLGKALNDGLDSKLTVNEIKEVLVHLYAYTGFPRSLNALSTFQSVLEQRAQKGIVDDLGKEASPLPANKTSEELGAEVLVQLVGTSEARGVRLFAPIVDTFLKAHLFGDLFGRDVLDFQSREISTISALSSMKGTESQLGSHLKVARNIGFTDEQLKEIAFEIAVKAGWQEGQVIAGKMKEILDIDIGETFKKIIRESGVSERETAKGSVIPHEGSQSIQIIRMSSQQSRRGSAEHFTGNVRIDSLFRASEPSRVYGASVTFDPGARTAWHSHPLGQILIVTAGSGRVQRWGDPIEEIRPGDVVLIPPDEKHWHGAAPHSAMTHFAIAERIEGRSTEWMEKVSGEE